MAGRYEYKVVEVREKMMGSKMSGDKLAKILNENASSGGWQLKAITAADVKGPRWSRRRRGSAHHV
jgi:hypothetical protein